MKIRCAFPDPFEARRWAEDLAAALPDAEVGVWSGHDEAADYAVTWRPSQEFLDGLHGLKAIFNTGAGVDAAAARRIPAGVRLVRLEDAGMAEQMSDYVLHAVLHHFRQFDAYAVQQAAGLWQPLVPRRKADYPVGVLGYGVLGRTVCRSLQAAGFPVHAWARTPKLDAPLTVHAGEAGFDPFVRATRILVCLLPLTRETSGILDAAVFARLIPGAYVINAARGAHLVIGDLLEAVATGRVAGATLDVFDSEPLAPDQEAWRHPAIRVTPHCAAATLREESVLQVAAKIRQMEGGAAVTGVVDSALGY